MARSLKYDIPGPDWRVAEDEVREKGWEAIFGSELVRPLRFVVEIGFGNGDFLIDCARREADAAHVGAEYSRKRVLKTARKLARTELANVRLLLCTGETLIRELLPEASVRACWINFPDPWPKKRHRRRRLLKPEFVHDLALRLEPGGSVHVATDHVDYAEAIDAALASDPRLVNACAPERFLRAVPDRMPTRYEREWRAEGRPLHFFEYRREVPH
ncbi:MAG: tRNA (guanosine(46)-N7)-methyltransferase TrmB [Deltaproteobacteria bacterium]|nr:MAG: tRNA (guanosine(46)-N7)-methyltransferase TrmB [Deltaproteobacteria bacterium]